MIEDTPMVDMIVSFADATIVKAMKSAEALVKPEDAPTYEGHYVILCDKPTPSEANNNYPNLKYNNLYVWYNGTSASGIRGRLKDHLFRSPKNRIKKGSCNGIRVTRNYSTQALSQNFKQNSDGSFFELGIDIREPLWADYNFYIVTQHSGLLSNILEQRFREVIGKPALIRSVAR